MVQSKRKAIILQLNQKKIEYFQIININIYQYDSISLHSYQNYNNKYFHQVMKTFRKKYVYNTQNPIYQSETAITYNCKNNETKEKRLVIIHHLKEPPFIQPSPGILQPIEMPTATQPYSVYPIVICCSQIGKVSEPQAMYVLKCLLESKIKQPLYYVISNQGICCSQVEGLLPSRSPNLFQLAIDMLDLPANLQQVQKSVVSKQGYGICKAIKNGESPLASLQNYGWKDIKKQKQQIYDQTFIIFKGRRKQEGPFGDQYGLAWANQHGLCRMKYIGLVRDGYEEQFYKEFSNVMNYIEKMDNSKLNPLFLKIHKWGKDQNRGIKIFTEIANQGTLTEYITKKNELNQGITQKDFTPVLQAFVQNMIKLSNQFTSRGLGTLHIKSFFVNNYRLCLGQPQLITDKTQKKLRQLKTSMDYYAPQLKQNIILPEKLFKLDREKMDIWSFGFILHKIFARQIPVFDVSKKPIIQKDKISPGVAQLISQCLDLTANNRPSWMSINFKELNSKRIQILQVEDQKPVRQQIKLGSKSQKRQRKQEKKQRFIQELAEERLQTKIKQAEDQKQKLKIKQQQEQEQLTFTIPVPTQISSRLKKIKLALKIIAVMLLYIFVFFRVFLGNTINIIAVRTFYTTATLQLVDYNSNQLSTITVITNDALFFLKNDISFTDIQQQYQCINDKLDPIYNPDYSLLTYIHSGKFLALILAGWATALVICVIKAISIWKGGISNRPIKKQGRFWVSYAFHELTLAALLFSHFYIFQFFYFSGATPCLNITTFTGLQPLFDSSLFLFLQNTNDYFQQVFSTLGVLSIFLVASTCFYAWGPKLQNKYFISVPSILLRIIPLILLLLLCRIGVFMLFSPTAINDTTKIIPAIMNGSFQGFVGILPEIFILITVLVQILIQLFMYWCQKKAAESDQLSKLFNIKDKKISIDQDHQSFNDMSIVNNSKHKLDISSIDQL